MNIELIVPPAIFLTIALGVWGVLSAVADKRSRATDRLERLMRQTAQRGASTVLLRKQDRIQALVAKVGPALAKPLQPKNEAELSSCV